MAGLLDPRTRILDTVVTLEGRRQIAAGKLRAEFCSFTDGGAFYALSDTYASGSQDMLARVGLESGNLPQDRVTFETDDSGKLVVREIRPVNDSMVSVLNGQLFSGSYGETKTPVGAEAFGALSDGLLSSSVDNFKNLYLLAPLDALDGREPTFRVFPQAVEFTITNERPLRQTAQTAHVDHMESLFADTRLSHVPNYRFLPPVNDASQTPLGSFVQIGERPTLEYSDVEVELAAARATGFAHDIRFTETSPQNRVVCQLFEFASSRMTKLDVIDFGLFAAADQATTRHVFFAGKLYVDSFGSHTFVHMFTLVWS